MDRISAGVPGGLLSVFNLMRRLASEKNVPVFLVGGQVRDAVLEISVRDLDFVLVGDAPALAADIADRLGGQFTVHSRIGTATVYIEGYHVDIVTARKESYSFPGSLPETSPSDLDDDLARRDFSINAMALPLSGNNPKIIDPFGGLKDLSDGLIRVLHSDSFADDPTRMMRAVRYEQRLGFDITVDTLLELGQTISRGHISAVSGDRWRQELYRVFWEYESVPILIRLMQLGILQGIHPALTDARAVNKLLGQSEIPSSHLISALVANMNSVDGDSLSQRLNMPSDLTRIVRDTITLGGLKSSISAPDVKISEICRILDALEPGAIEATVRFTSEPLLSERLIRYLREWRQLRGFLTGDDLLDMGIPSGPRIGKILRELRSALLDGLVSNMADERTLIGEIIQRGD